MGPCDPVGFYANCCFPHSDGHRPSMVQVPSSIHSSTLANSNPYCVPLDFSKITVYSVSLPKLLVALKPLFSNALFTWVKLYFFIIFCLFVTYILSTPLRTTAECYTRYRVAQR